MLCFMLRSLQTSVIKCELKREALSETNSSGMTRSKHISEQGANMTILVNLLTITTIEVQSLVVGGNGVMMKSIETDCHG